MCRRLPQKLKYRMEIEASMRMFTVGAFIFSMHLSRCPYSDSFFSDNGEVWCRVTVNVVL